jgi:YHS domain-containing protein
MSLVKEFKEMSTFNYKYEAIPVEVDDDYSSQGKTLPMKAPRSAFHNCLIFGLPMIILFLSAWILVTVSSSDKDFSVSNIFVELKHHHTTKTTLENPKSNLREKETTCSSCPSSILAAQCSSTDNPVLGGIDFVDFYSRTGENSQGDTAVEGLSTIQSVYNGYTFNFLTESNKAAFEKSPETYVPQFGGFCSWGIGGEFCPEYPWSADCLGPSGDWSLGYKYKNRLYFFYKSDAMEKFMADPEYYVKQGTTRWSAWFGDKTVFSTNCFVAESSNTKKSAKSKKASSGPVKPGTDETVKKTKKVTTAEPVKASVTVNTAKNS